MLKAKKNSLSFNLKFLQSSKFWAFFVFFLILGGLPISLYEVQQQQEIRQHAATYLNQTRYYDCGSNVQIQMVITETPNCTPGDVVQGLPSFESVANLSYSKNLLGNTYTIKWKWAKFFCPDNVPTSGTACLVPVQDGNGGVASGTVSLGPGQSTSAPDTGLEKPQQVNPAYSSCGWYQNDFGFEVLNSSGAVMCDYSFDADLGSHNANFSYCKSNVVCSVPTPTPTTPVNTPTPTIPINTPTPTLPIDTPTETPVPSATPTATPSATPTFTITPTGTLTPSATPTVTPTGNPTATPVPPGSPTPTVIVFKPTLPPTGPGNTILSVGLVGVAIAVLGMAFLLGV